MRDHKRINRILKKFAAEWKKYPDMRFLQLVECLIPPSHARIDKFYIEDDIFEKHLDELKVKNEP
jgi:uncharacterized protein YihD (DUF1040 family)